MTTKTTFNIYLVVVTLAALVLSFADSLAFILAGVALAGCAFTILLYGVFREQTYGDKSPTVPRRSAAIMIGFLCLWVAVCCYRVWKRGL